MSPEKTFYITTPIYYPNGIPHVGTAYTTVAADVLARWHRLSGRKVFFLTGTDEHGQKVEQAAKSKGMKVETYVDEISDIFRTAWRRLEISNDDFIRTSEKRHVEVASRIFQVLHKQGDIYAGHYEGWYCVSCETYWLESQLAEGKCPNPECGKPVEWLKEEEYFFRLSAYQERLLAHYRENPDFVMPKGRRNEVVRFVSLGLQDLCVSRKGLAWGIPVPGDPSFSIYVWIDALSNYLSAIGYLSESASFQERWPADLHLVGKDILRFHAVIWPAMLMALGLPLPKMIYATGWLTMGGSKISKSRGGHRNLLELLDLYGTDPVRYFLMREASFGSDLDFSEEGIIRRLNSDLANDLGNLAHRVISMIHRYFGGTIPKPGERTEEPDRALRKKTEDLPEILRGKLEELAFREALEAIFDCVTMGNRYVDEMAPWKLKKEGKEERLAAVLYQLAEMLRMLAVFLFPFLPRSAETLWKELGLPDSIAKQKLSDLRWGQLQPDQPIGNAVPLFRKEVSGTVHGGTVPDES